MPIKPIVENLTSMRDQMIYHSLMGEYKEYVSLHKKYAKQCVTFPEEVKYMPQINARISIFSKFGWNLAKTWFRELFRIKTPEEKELNRMSTRQKAKNLSGWNG